MVKRFTLLILAIIVALGSASANNLPELKLDIDKAINAVENGLPELPQKGSPTIQADKKYIFFTNLDPEYGFIAYYMILNNIPAYKDQFFTASFSDETFNQNNITDFDVAIFAMSGISFTAKTQSGNHTIIGKINEMLEAGKEVIIITFGGIYYQYDPASPGSIKSDDVDAFLSGVLGINYTGMIPQGYTQGNTFYMDTFLIVGSRHNSIIDSVTKGTSKYCNGGINNISPLAYVRSTESFTLDEKDMQFDIDHYDGYTSPALCGVRRNYNGSRIVLWSYPFPVVAGFNAQEAMLKGAMDWVLAEDRVPGALFEFISNSKVDFGIVDPGESREIELEFANIGATTLTVSDIYLDWNEEGAYKITSGGSTPINIESYESHKLTVEFTPPAEEDYPAFLVIENNSDNRSSAEFDLSGSGGKRNGAYWTTNIENDKIDFGYAKQFDYVDVDIIIENIGQVELIVNYYDFDAGQDDAFDVRLNDYYPITIEAGETFKQTIRFVPLTEGVTYTGSIKYNTNASNGSEWKIEFIGREGMTPGARIQTSMDNQHKINFSKVIPNETKTETFGIINVGNIPLNIFSFAVDNQDHNAFKVTSDYEFPIVVTSDDSISVDVSFTPTTPNEIYQGTLAINSNAVNEDPFEISLYGIADNAGSVPSEASSTDGLITLSASPNPAINFINVDYTLIANRDLSVEMYLMDISGKRVMDVFNTVKYAGEYQQNIDLNNLASGQYFIIITTQSSVAKLPIIVVK